MMVVSGVRCLPPPNPSVFTGDGTNTYLIGERDIVVVDPGPDVSGHVERIIKTAGELHGSIAALLVTHAHSDHLAASYHLRDRTGAPIYAYESIPDVDYVVQSGDVLTFDSCELEVHETPGHADDHVCYLLREERILFSGDLISGTGSVLLSESPNALSDYLASLERMLDLRPSIILPGHGPRIDSPTRRINQLLAHREKRSRQILGYISLAPRSIDDIVAFLYSNTAAELRSFARRNVTAHLNLLSAKGEVRVDGGKWAATSSR